MFTIMLNQARMDIILSILLLPTSEGIVALNVIRKAVQIKPEIVVNSTFILELMNFLKSCIVFNQ